MKLLINDNWKLLYRSMDAAGDDIADVESSTDFISAGCLPCDVRMPLIEHGIIKDPIVADYSFESEWVEEKSWWFTNTFVLASQDITANGIRLVIESLDLCADIFVNGKHVGIHNSCHYPFEKEIMYVAKEGTNRLTIRLTAGHEKVSAEDANRVNSFVATEQSASRGMRGDARRVFLRKPQYVFGWDWASRVVSVGIMKDVYININRGFSVTDVHPVTVAVDANKASMRFNVNFEYFEPIATADAVVRLDMSYKGKSILSLSKEVLAQPGANHVSFEAEISNPQLWWSNGAGDQPLYMLSATIINNEKLYLGEPIQVGLRTVSLNTEKRKDNRRMFSLQINGIDIFCKGANWIPADSIYARTSPEKYEVLIKEARECNFNMLRVWGGGLYEPDLFYDLCDRYGILVWQDFMFACGLYPDDAPGFTQLVEKEVDYQTTRLRHHPCIVLWCGNNEIQYLYEDACLNNPKQGIFTGMDIFNKVIPKVMQANCAEIPYWRSSPFGGGKPNDDEIGNKHFWSDCTMNPEMIKRITPEEYDKIRSSFVTEYGYIGPCSDATIQKYYGDNEIAHGDVIWNLHNNTFEKETVSAGIMKHYADPDTLELPDYLQYARLVQGLMYSYSLESIRFFEYSGGSLFWMYNDAWGEVGWSIVDYYLDRKPSYYHVKRAYAPVKLILRIDDKSEVVHVMGVNDTPHALNHEIEYGYVGFDGVYDRAKKAVTISPFTKSIIFSFAMPRHDLRAGVVYTKADGIPLAILRTNDYKGYKERESEINIEHIKEDDGNYHITVKSTGYCHAVHFTPYMELSDEYFDMLPGETRTLIAYDAVDCVKKEEICAVKI